MTSLQTPSERIKQRRNQMLIHSYLYYHMDTSIVSDDQWQRWADELTTLQKEHPNVCDFYNKSFEDWDGSTGMHLPTDVWIRHLGNLLSSLLLSCASSHSWPCRLNFYFLYW